MAFKSNQSEKEIAAKISAIAAIGATTHVLGDDNKLVWHIPEDLKRFKTLTMGHPVIMGRKTFDSIIASLGRPLPGRTNIVITRDESWHHEDVEVAHSLDEAFEKADALDSEEIFIIGGAQIYAQALPFIDCLYLTLVHDDASGDTLFPEYEHEFTKKIAEESGESNGLTYTWVQLERQS